MAPEATCAVPESRVAPRRASSAVRSSAPPRSASASPQRGAAPRPDGSGGQPRHPARNVDERAEREAAIVGVPVQLELERVERADQRAARVQRAAAGPQRRCRGQLRVDVEPLEAGGDRAIGPDAAPSRSEVAAAQLRRDLGPRAVELGGGMNQQRLLVDEQRSRRRRRRDRARTLAGTAAFADSRCTVWPRQRKDPSVIVKLRTSERRSLVATAPQASPSARRAGARSPAARRRSPRPGDGG